MLKKQPQRIGCTNCYYITKPHWGEKKNETGKINVRIISWNFNIVLLENSLQFKIDIHICWKIKGYPG